eukprot:381020-Amphidinium_carterae.1
MGAYWPFGVYLGDCAQNLFASLLGDTVAHGEGVQPQPTGSSTMAGCAHAARSRQFPERLAYMACAAYTQPRRIQWRGQATCAWRVCGTIVPGCGMANALAMLVMQDAHEEVAALGLNLELKNVIDDLSIQSYGSSGEVVEAIHLGSEVLLSWLQRQGLPPAPEKSVCITNCSHVQEQLEQ